MLQRLFDDQREAFQKSDLFSSRVVSSFIEEKEQMPWIPSIRRNIKIPAPAQSWFTEATPKGTTPRVRERCKELIESFHASGRCDLVTEFARLSPTTIS
jgi:hypothetical protein